MHSILDMAKINNALQISSNHLTDFVCETVIEHGLGTNSRGDSHMDRSSPLRPFPRVLLCPLSIPKVTIVYGVGCSLNLNISYYCSSVSWEYRRRLVEYGQAIDPQNLPLSGHPLLQKTRTFGLGPPRPP